MKTRHAFTLIELLLALAITSLLVILLANVVSATLAAWRHGQNRLVTFSTARQQLERIADEIRGAIASAGRIDFIENDGSIGNSQPTPEKSEDVFFIAPYPNSAAGDLCVVAYRHDATNYTLERAFVDSAKAWSVSNPSNRYQIGGYAGNLQWRKIADGVVEFELRSYSQTDLDTTATPVPSWNSAGAGAMHGKTPRMITIRLKAVDDQTLARLISAPPASDVYSRIVNQNARDFSTSVTLPRP